MWLLSGSSRQRPTSLCKAVVVIVMHLIRHGIEDLVFLLILAHDYAQVHIPAGNFVLKGAQLGRNTHQAGIATFYSDLLSHVNVPTVAPGESLAHLIVIRWLWAKPEQPVAKIEA